MASLRTAPSTLATSATSALATGTGLLRAAPQTFVSAPQTILGAGITGLQTVAEDGMNIILLAPHTALQTADTMLRSGGAIVNGGTRFLVAGGDSLVNSGINTVSGGGRVLVATASSGVRLAGQALDRLRRLF